ncbi:unnamed protein product, partial [Laminaria digitata]
SGYISHHAEVVDDSPLKGRGGGGGKTEMDVTPETAANASTGPAGAGGDSPVTTFEVSFVPLGGWTPTLCEECMAAAHDRAEVAKSVFKDKAVSVLRLKGGEDPPVPDPKLTGLDGGEGVAVTATGRPQRKSRARGGTAPFVVICSSDETVGFFKLKVYQSAEVIPRRQTLFLKGVPLSEGSATLQEAGVKAGDTLHLKVEDTNPDDAVDGSIDDTHLFTEGLTTKRPAGPELGFAGTALSGGGGRRATPPP